MLDCGRCAVIMISLHGIIPFRHAGERANGQDYISYLPNARPRVLITLLPQSLLCRGERTADDDMETAAAQRGPCPRVYIVVSYPAAAPETASIFHLSRHRDLAAMETEEHPTPSPCRWSPVLSPGSGRGGRCPAISHARGTDQGGSPVRGNQSMDGHVPAVARVVELSYRTEFMCQPCTGERTVDFFSSTAIKGGRDDAYLMDGEYRNKRLLDREPVREMRLVCAW